MKILVLSNLYPPHSIGGYEERCRQIIDRLRARGHDVRVLTSTHGLTGEAIEGHVHRRLWIHGYFGHAWLPIQRLFGLEKHNQSVLREELADFRPDVAHVWNLGGISKALTLTLQNWGGKVVYDVSDHWIARSLRADVWMQWWNRTADGASSLLRGGLRALGLAGLIRRAAPFAPFEEVKFPRIYFCSDSMKQITIEKGYALEHAAVIYCGIETEKFAQRAPSDRFTRLLYVGRLSEDKDPLTAIRALKLLPEPYTLSLYGRGDAEYTRQLQAEAAPLNGRVHFRSAPAEEMAGVYAEHDALLFTSAWEEPFALTPLEAMAARLPVIGTLAGGSRELIRHGENALSFRTGDPADLAAQVREMAADAGRRAAMTELSRREVVERYDLGPITSQIETYLAQS